MKHENKILNYDYNKIIKDFRIKERIKKKSLEKVSNYSNRS